jgi:hypothetical protein
MAAKVNALLGAFNRGVVSLKALGRVDIERLRFAAEDQTNFVPSKLGSMMLRPGFGYLLNTSTRLPYYLPFVFAIDDTALIELTDGQVRIIKDDAALTLPAVTSTITNGTFATDISGWTSADESGATGAFAGSSGSAAAALSTRTVYDSAEAATATAKYKLDNDGIAYTMRDVLDASTYQAISGEWLLSGAAGSYECRATVVSGTPTSGTTGSWLNLGTDREWTQARATNGTSTTVLTVEVRPTGGTTTLASATITLKATRVSSGGYDPGCVCGTMWLTPSLQASNARVGDELTVMGDDWKFLSAPITDLDTSVQPCSEVATASGATLECSDSTRFVLRDGRQVETTQLLGQDVLVEQPDGAFVWEIVTAVTSLGARQVYEITVGNRSYAAGTDAKRRIVSHNVKP